MRTFKIPKDNLPKLLSKIKLLTNKAKKLGAEMPHFKILGNSVEKREIDYRSVEIEVTEVEVDDVSIKLGGWDFLCTIDHDKNGNVLRFIKNSSDKYNTEQYRTKEPYCEHCRTKRTRKSTFLMVHENGELRQVGKNCLRDFLGHASAEFYAQWNEYLNWLEESESMDERSLRHEFIYTVEEVVSIACMAMRLHGCYKSSMHGKDSTKYFVQLYLTCFDANEFENRTGMKMPSLQNQDTEQAKQALNYVLGLEESDLNNDFLRNINALCKREYLKEKDFGMVCYLPELYSKHLIKTEEVAQKRLSYKEAAEKSQYVGEVGSKLSCELLLVRTVYLGSHAFGETYLHIFNDTHDNKVVWKTGKLLNSYQNRKIIVSGTVKAHTLYGEMKQTELTRCRIKEIEENN